MTLSWDVGRVTVTRVEESITPVPAGYLVTGLTDDHIAAQRPWVEPYFDGDGAVLLSVHSFIIDTGDMTIVVDTCAGMHDGRPLPGDPSFLDRLAAEIDGGLDAVDVVICTHLHFDHIGWNTIRDRGGRWVPAFPNAQYLITDEELDGFDERDPEHMADAGITPLADAGLLVAVELDHRITPEVRLLSTPGHSRGHVSVLIESGGATGLVTGDAAHTPIQFAYPELAASRVDHDSERSTQTRRDLVERFIDTDALIFGSHFAPPTAGVLRTGSDGGTIFGQPAGEPSGR